MKTLLYGVAVLLLCASSASAQDPIVGTTELFERLSPERWEVSLPGPGSALQLHDKELLIANRAYLLSRGTWDGGSIVFDWKPAESRKADDGHVYGDHIAVLLFSDGTIRKERSYEPLSGIVVRIDSTRGDVYIQSADGEGGMKNLATKKGDGNPIDPTTWHEVAVTYDSKELAVSLDGKQPLTVAFDSTGTKRRWGIFNREAVAGGNASMIKRLSYKGR